MDTMANLTFCGSESPVSLAIIADIYGAHIWCRGRFTCLNRSNPHNAPKRQVRLSPPRCRQEPRALRRDWERAWQPSLLACHHFRCGGVVASFQPCPLFLLNKGRSQAFLSTRMSKSWAPSTGVGVLAPALPPASESSAKSLRGVSAF